MTDRSPSLFLSEEHAATVMAAVNHEANDVAGPFLEAIAASEDASSLRRYGLFDTGCSTSPRKETLSCLKRARAATAYG
jgi:hypothetical protein